MRLLTKFIAALSMAFVVPVAVLGLEAAWSMHRIEEHATRTATSSISKAEKEVLGHLATERALAIDAVLARFQSDTELLRTAFEAISARSGVGADAALYPPSAELGLLGYGALDVERQIWADLEGRGINGLYLLPREVGRLLEEPALRPRVDRDTRRLASLTPLMSRIGAAHGINLHLVWTTLEGSAANIWPPYDYPEMVSSGGFVQLEREMAAHLAQAGAEANPRRSTRWQDPHLDRVRGVWMTSCAAPLYDDQRFRGAVGVDVLLPSIVQTVLELRPGSTGYAFLIGASGRLVAAPERAIDELTWDPLHAEGLRRAVLQREPQAWTDEMVRALEQTSLADSPDPDLRQLVAQAQAGLTSVEEYQLAGRAVYVGVAPVRRSGWSLVVVRPVGEALESATEIRGLIRRGVEDVIGKFLLYFGLTVVGSLAVGAWLQALGVRPLEELAEDVAGMRGDRLTLPRDHSARNDEIGTLYRKFSELLEALRNDRAALTRQGRELAEQKERLSVTIASIADAMLATDAEGRVVLMNPLAERMAGCTEAEAHGQLARDLFPLEREGGGEIDPVAAVLQSGQSWGPHGSTRLQQVGKRSLPVSESCAPMMGPEGRRLGAVLVLRDMSEVRRIEAELARMDRLATVQVLAAGLAHDFNNLLATIQSGVELVSARVGPQKDVAPLERVQRAILRARQLTRQLLTFTSGGDPIRELLDLAPLVSEAAAYGLRGSTRLRIDLPAELWPVRADDGQLAQVIQNLVLNASQVMREGGEVQISGRNLGAGGSGPMAGSPAVELQVRDRGPGIEPEHLGRIFEPFFSRRAGGSGLGLAVCHSIVQRHGGHIAVESTLGVGTVFTIWLPASPGERPPRPALPPPSLHQAVRAQPGRVLVMDDEPELRSLLMEMLGALGMEAVGAEDGQQALHEVQLAASAGRPFGLVILDLTVPGRMGGIEAASALRRLDPQLPLVVSSGYNDAPASARPEDFGFAGALPKPYTLADLSAALRRHLRAGPS